MAKLILAINPGSTSTKIGLFDEHGELFRESLVHDAQKLDTFPSVNAQREYRYALINTCLKDHHVLFNELVAVVGRGGMLPPVQSGGYVVNETMKRLILESKIPQHASNLGAILAADIADPLGIPAYIYDAVTVDELMPVASITGFPEVVRHSFCHVLNSKAMARQYASSIAKRYEDISCIVAHLGGGITMSAHMGGQIIDSLSDDDGAFGPERSGAVPLLSTIELCYSGRYSKAEMQRKVRGSGGLKALLGTADCREIEHMIDAGDSYATEVYAAQAYQIAKGIALMSPALKGKIDVIILTGGIAYSKRLTDQIIGWISYLAPIAILPGEFELEAMADGARRIVNGIETAHTLEDSLLD